MENWPLALYIKALIAILLIAPLERFRTFCWRRRLVVALLGLMAAGTVQAATCTSQGSGNWNTAATWKCPTTANFSNVGTFTDGSKVQKTRPCAVVSPTEIHDHLRTVMVAPMTTRAPPAGFPVSQTFQGQSGLVLLGQPRTLDKLRQVKRLGSIEPATLKQLQVTLQAVFQPA